jgi:hypothetical protein
LLAVGCGGGATNNSAAQTTQTTGASSSTFAFVANELSANISGYLVNSTTGGLTPLAGFPVPSGLNPTTIVVDPHGHFAFVGDIAQSLLMKHGN